ncbi:3-hydroxyacyl-CoA dehydrogenase NAD-binding domain-containing protein [Chelativorans sp. AA-79]|uniref:3-hydroxyacyl-CoA dehydrogenase NAD-binding domain-containing protein n=1 Tax=Chelativorans sp. AA-79 TaxID=3028735 RepID=UPI0023F9A6CA|nr:3-hydroxyacyl-CoA dehydrogenase NAD-binding domain-containing protein [Chelativorans sp. AA-79]WEX09044.1 3-hydroxyacyl-CoA dehydrogenase NAD-binding domain-containing protein [Chelativorans sp. AA-79]
MTDFPAAASETVFLTRQGDVAVITIDNPPVNAGSRSVRAGVLSAVQAIGRDKDVRAAVLAAAGRTFVAGSDLKEFGRPLEDPQWPVVLTAIESCPVPVVAAIHGAALGGGYELALACDWRVADRAAVVGLPEIGLGMIPGAGGTQRLPRLAGIASAIEVITSGRRVPAVEALEAGMIDATAEGDLLEFAIAFARSKTGSKRLASRQPLPPEPEDAIEKAIVKAEKGGRARPNVRSAIETVLLARTVPIETALERERETFQTLRQSEEAAALRYNFFAERKAAKVDEIGGSPAKIGRLAVIGAGTMGAGIASVFAAAGHAVTVVDTNSDALARAGGQIESALAELERFGKLKIPLASAQASLSFMNDLAAAANADLIIEAVFEDMAIKMDVMQALGGIARADAIIATNTSYLDVEQLADASGRPERFFGLHFFAPVPRMRLVEVVRCRRTSPDTLCTGIALSKEIGKLPILSGPCEGFIGNRIYAKYRAQCEYMLEEGGLPETIDAAMQALGFAMGPFAVSDLSGLDIAWRNRRRKATDRDPRERYVVIPDKICEMGRLGRKTGAGWYLYPEGAKAGVPDPIVAEMVRAESQRRGIVTPPSEKDMQHRVLGAIVNEAALILEEGIARSAAEIDLVLVNGYGFSKYRGGPIYLAARMPRQDVWQMVEKAEAATGFGFRRGDVDALLDSLR